MKKEEIVSILSEWNFWGKGLDTGKERALYLDKISGFLEGVEKVISVYGVRRSGKSFLLRQVAKRFSERLGKDRVLYVNFEEARFSSNEVKTLIEIYDAYREFIRPCGKPLVILDEVQEIKEWERFVRSLHEKNEARLVVSGSSAKLMSEELATLLSGRDIPVEIFPLSFREFLKFKGIELKDEENSIIRKFEIIQRLREYLEFGGFPEVVLEESEEKKKAILKRYFETIIVKDVERRFNIRERGKLEFLANFYITNISSPVTYSSVSKTLKMPKKTVERFSSHLATSRALFFVPRFSPTLKEQEKAARKVYSIDTGMSNTVGYKIFENYGKTMENVVAVELLRRFSTSPTTRIYHVKVNEREVDFAVKEGLKINQLIQVSYVSDRDEISKREIEALLKAGLELKCNNLSIITWDVEEQINVNGKTIKLIPLWKWLLSTH
ncbi:MAG: ATP-binding protein [Candidatus Brockarchaeota archaeon]|nr:ATP-binding protein [Candidatus Brockarchaeota archaeon]